MINSELVQQEHADHAETGKTQVVERVALILAALSKSGINGSRLKDLALNTGIARPSVHRILGELADVNLVEKTADRKYTLGSMLFTLGLSAPSPIQNMTAIREVAQDLATLCGDVVYVALRQFNGVHYLVRAEGAYPIRTHLVAVGDTKPFTSSYSGIALLSQMAQPEQQVMINRLELDAPKEWVATHRNQLRRMLWERIEEVRTLGYCAGPNLVMPGIAGIAAPVPSNTQTPYMTISISAVEQRLNAERIAAIAPRLLEAAQRISQFII
jgi:DNA-binding IclR family transcriptional regulator